ncbi:hypothetical protein JCM10212_005710 [Sporobolomyces blumeae]
MPAKAAAKSSASTEPAQSYSPGDIVLGKIKGYPAWPGRVLESESASKKVAKEKPTKGKATHLVQFFPTGDFAWLGARDLSALTPKEIDAYVNGGSKKKGELLEGYKIARNPEEWITQKEDEAAAHQALLDEQDAMDEDDQLASDGEAAGAKKDKTKKRKRETPANGKKDDKKKTVKKDPKAKASVKKDYTDDEAEPASKKPKASGDSDAETVKGWRHKLQKIFLGKANPAPEEMPKCAEYFDAMENFDMKKEWLIESKLAKVLKRIAILKEGAIPDDDKYKFRERSSALAAKWAGILGGNAAGSPKPDDASATAGPSTDAAPATENGSQSAPAPAAEDETPAAEAGDETTDKKDESAPMAVETNGEDKAEPAAVDEAPKDAQETQLAETPATEA